MAIARLVTWNVNSLRARLPRVLELLDVHAPDVLCMQETRVADQDFPEAELAEAGYVTAHHSRGQWAGVALCARRDLELEDVTLGLPGEVKEDEARFITARVDGLRLASVYVPNGQRVGSPQFDDKLAFLDAMTGWVQTAVDDGPLVLAGDLNVCLTDQDVYDPTALHGATHVTDDERRRLAATIERGLVDTQRALHPDAGQDAYTWWDYRAGMYHKRLGLRIDYVLADPETASRAQRIVVDRRFRKGTKPSDHAPLVVDLADPGTEPDVDPTVFVR